MTKTQPASSGGVHSEKRYIMSSGKGGSLKYKASEEKTKSGGISGEGCREILGLSKGGPGKSLGGKKNPFNAQFNRGGRV